MRNAAVFFGLACLAAAQTVTIEHTTFIEHTTVIDPAGGAPLRDYSLLIQDGRIAQLGKRVVAPKGAMVVNARGKFLIPGLWDMHVHITEPRIQFPLLVANGIIGIREMYSAASIAQQRAWAKAPDSPQVVVPGFIDGPQPRPGGAWPDAYAIVDAESARAAVQLLVAQKADFIKIYNGIPRAAFFALSAAARAAGIPFVGHVPEEVSPLEAAEAGMRSQEHLNDLLLAASTNETALRQQRVQVMNDPALSDAARLRLLGWPLTEGLFDTYDPQKAAILFQTFVRNGTYQTPTLSVLSGYAHAVDRDSISDPRRNYVPKTWTDLWSPQGSPYLSDLSAEDYRLLNLRMRALLARYEKLTGDMARAGVTLLAGTDTNPVNPVLPGFGLHAELALLVESGLTPAQALQTATLNPARYFGREKEMGSVAVGKSADLVLLDADPTRDIRNTQKINAVVMRGHLYTREDLDAMLEKTRALAGH